MTVEELITKLNDYPKDLVVLVRGYESGFNDIEEVETRKLVHQPGEWWDGDYQVKEHIGSKEEGKEYLTLDY